MTSETGIVEAVIETPCLQCRRLARYTGYHRADEAILARLQQPITHRDVHAILFDLESLHEQVEIGICECGAPGSETTSTEFAHRAVREDLNFISDDHAYEVRKLSRDGKVLWTSDGELRQRIISAPDPTPDEFLLKQQEREQVFAAANARLQSVLQRGGDHEQPAAEYIEEKARRYCQIGADAYRASDALGQPDARLGADALDAIRAGMQQFADGKGLSADRPLENIPARFSHALARVLHFKVIAQHGKRSDDGTFILDTLRGKHLTDGREAAIFNKVPTGRRTAP